MLKKGLFLIIFLLSAFLLFPSLSNFSVVHASTSIVVNDLGDNTTAGDGKCTLREAIKNANTESDTTSGDCAAGTYTDIITFSVGGTISLGSDLPYSDNVNLTIDGTGQSVTIDGNSAHQIFSLNSAFVTYTLNKLTLTNGKSPIGGAIYNVGVLNISNCTFFKQQGF